MANDEPEDNPDEGNLLWCNQCEKIIDESEYKPDPDDIEYDVHLDHRMSDY